MTTQPKYKSVIFYGDNAELQFNEWCNNQVIPFKIIHTNSSLLKYTTRLLIIVRLLKDV